MLVALAGPGCQPAMEVRGELGSTARAGFIGIFWLMTIPIYITGFVWAHWNKIVTLACSKTRISDHA